MASELDLTEAIRAGCDGWEGDYSVTSAIEAAAPIIERQVREQITNRILDLTPYNCELRPDGSEDPIRAAYAEAVREAVEIARGER